MLEFSRAIITTPNPHGKRPIVTKRLGRLPVGPLEPPDPVVSTSRQPFVLEPALHQAWYVVLVSVVLHFVVEHDLSLRSREGESGLLCIAPRRCRSICLQDARLTALLLIGRGSCPLWSVSQTLKFSSIIGRLVAVFQVAFRGSENSREAEHGSVTARAWSASRSRFKLCDEIFAKPWMQDCTNAVPPMNALGGLVNVSSTCRLADTLFKPLLSAIRIQLLFSLHESLNLANAVKAFRSHSPAHCRRFLHCCAFMDSSALQPGDATQRPITIAPLFTPGSVWPRVSDPSSTEVCIFSPAGSTTWMISGMKGCRGVAKRQEPTPYRFLDTSMKGFRSTNRPAVNLLSGLNNISAGP